MRYIIRGSLFVPTCAMLCMAFDPDSFMSQNVDAPMDTVIAQCPEGEYRAMIDDFENDKAFRTFTSAKNGKDYTVFSPPFVIQDDTVAQTLGRDKVTVFHKGMFIDLNDQGGIDSGKGKNVDLGRLRDSLGQNVAGQPWNFNMLKGAGPVMVKVVHESDKDDPEKKYARVTRVVKIS